MARIDIIGEIDAEISRLQQAKALLSGTDSVAAKRRPGRPIGSGLGNKLPVTLPSKAKVQPRRKMSAAGRARIAAAMKMRWAKVRRAAKKASGVAAKAVQGAAQPLGTKRAAKKATSKKVPAKKATQSQATTAASPNS